MKVLITGVLAGLVVLASVSQAVSGATGKSEGSGQLKVYQVNKKVCDFPEGEDLSTPEAAYATANRFCASGEQDWRRISAKRLASRMRVREGKRKVSKSAANGWLNAKIVEVRLFRGTHASVTAKVRHPWKKLFDYRTFELEDGKWLNAGNSVFGSLDEAREDFAAACEIYSDRQTVRKRQRVDNPEAHLKPFVEFLKAKGEEPRTFVMKALAKHKVVIMGEVHHRPRYWAFNSSLVADPDFAKYTGTIYMELPSNDQKLIDKFLAGDKCDKWLVVETLRDMLWLGWPDKPMLDFFITAWKVNQNLESEHRLRIVLVDMERPWKKIEKREDWREYDVDRNQYMADNIVRDIQKHPNEERNRLFIVGVGHTGLNLKFYGGTPLKTAGWHLRDKLGAGNIYAIFPHRCVMTNAGRVDGRLCLGLFDSAFAKLNNKPIAFPLDTGPFGKEHYDASPDKPVRSNYLDGFNAYLYLGLLESEAFSSLIDGFYTDEFVKELERRYRLMYGKGWAESYGREKSDAESFINWMSGNWGRPRKWRNKLGPIDAWKYGDDWEEGLRKEEHAVAFKRPDVIKTAAENLFEAIRNADYERHSDGSDWGNFLPETIDYEVHHHFDSWVRWVCKTFKENPIESVELGGVSKDRNGLPAISYVVRLRDRRQLKGVLPFRYMPRQEFWMGTQGIDWHLQYADSTEGKKKAKVEPAETRAETASVSTVEIPEVSTVDRSSPEATVRSWTKAVARGNVQDALACMLPGGVDYGDVKEILSAEPSSRKFFIKKMWLAIDTEKPIEILGKELIEDEAGIGWEFYFREDFTVKGRTFKRRGDAFEFDASLKKHGDYWLIDNI
ncbi:MAG: hypothetical protein ACYSYV_05960 [Planctomycetota bacterium]|jgi:hypothetical protein